MSFGFLGGKYRITLYDAQGALEPSGGSPYDWGNAVKTGKQAASRCGKRAVAIEDEKDPTRVWTIGIDGALQAHQYAVTQLFELVKKCAGSK